MTKIKIEGPGATVIGKLIDRALKAHGLTSNFWYNVTPSEIRACRSSATAKKADVSVLSMAR